MSPTAAAVPEERQRGLPEFVRPATVGIPIVILALLLAGAATTSGFINGTNLAAILLSASITGIAAVAMTPIVLSGNFVSLATSSSGALAAVAFTSAVAAGWNVALAIVATLALLAVIGLLQGAIVAAGLNPVLTTLAAAGILSGALARITGGVNVTFGAHPLSWGQSNILGLQLSVYVFAVVTIVAAVLMQKTVLGRQIMLSGANRRTAELSGISVLRVSTWAFVVFSLGVAITGILWSAQISNAGTESLSTLTIDAIAAVLVGGTAIQGGFGSPLRSAGGALIIALATNIMLLHGAGDGLQQTVVGGVVILVVIVLNVLGRRR